MSVDHRAAEDLLADLNDLPDDPNAVSAGTGNVADVDEASINDFLAEFSRDRERPASRPITPRLQGTKARASPRLSTHSDKTRKSTDASRASTDSRISSNREETQTFTNSSAANSDKSEKPDEQESHQEPAGPRDAGSTQQKKVYGSGNSWSSWGGSLWSTANNIQAQLRAEAEKRLADLQASEEAQAIQARLRELDLSKLASEARNIGKGVLDAVAPPIEDNETLVVNVLHDLAGVRVERSAYNSFERVMEQVEGGALRVVATKDREGTLQLNVLPVAQKDVKKISLAAIDDQAKSDTTQHAERTSNIYLSIQAYTLIAAEAAPSSGSDVPKEEEEDGEEPEVQFAVALVDHANHISLTSTSQAFPASWEPLALESVEAAMQPREWISEWVEETLQLVMTVLAQRYVARRMGIDKWSSAAAGDDSAGHMKGREGQDLSEAGLGL